MLFDIEGNEVKSWYDVGGKFADSAFTVDGEQIFGDYNRYSTEYERLILAARDEWMTEARASRSVLPVVIHTDQHGKLTANNDLFSFLSKAVPWKDTSAVIGLGDVVTNNYSESAFQAMVSCLSQLPAAKQINIWGNHDTWTSSWYSDIQPPTEAEVSILNQYFDNSNFPGHKRLTQYGVEEMTDAEKAVKYVVVGGWNYDKNLGGHSHYVIDSDGLDAFIRALESEEDVVVLSHIQPFKNNRSHDKWTIPYEDENGGGGLSSANQSAAPSVVVNPNDTALDQMLIDRKNKTSGIVNDSYGKAHSYDFSTCKGELLCFLAGHEHCNWYTHQNGNMPVVIFDAYAFDKHPFYFVNINRDKEKISVWRVDETPQVVKWTIPFKE